MTTQAKSQDTRARSSGKDETMRIDYRHLPRVRVQSNRPTLREIFLLGWHYFLPQFPSSTTKRRQDRTC